MNNFARQLFDDVEAFCLPLNVAVVRTMESAEAAAVVIQEAQAMAFEVTLIADHSLIGSVVNTELERLFSRPPYRVLDELHGTGFRAQYVVGSAEPSSNGNGQCAHPAHAEAGRGVHEPRPAEEERSFHQRAAAHPARV